MTGVSRFGLKKKKNRKEGLNELFFLNEFFPHHSVKL